MGRLSTMVLWLAATLCGCNTCLDTNRVPFSAADVGLGDAALSDAGSDRDTDACQSETTEEICASAEAECGPVRRLACGMERTVDCGGCNAGACNDSNTCECQSGYVRDAESQSCVDVDECLDQPCSEGENCTNLIGSHQCSTCPPGTLDEDGDGLTCVDIDECAEGLDDCDPLVTCVNTDPGYECGGCRDGYEFGDDGRECVDIDECARGTDDCDAEATCSNEDGSYSCRCRSGYSGDGFTCTPQLIVSVSHHSLTLRDRDTVATAGLPAGIDFSRAVPFVTASVDAQAGGSTESSFVDVFINANGELQADRTDGDGRVGVEVSLVEFQSAEVQKGTFLTNDELEQIAIGTVDVDHSFVVFTGQVSGTNADREEAMVSIRLQPNRIDVERSDRAGAVEGHYSVVSATADEFSVQHDLLTISGTSRCGSLPIVSVDSDRSFVLHSTRVLNPTRSASVTNVRCSPTDSGDMVQCCRGAGGLFGSSGIGVEVQVVTFDASLDADVIRRDETVSGLGMDVVVGTFEPDRTTPSLGSIGVAGAVTVDDGIFISSEASSFASAAVVGNDTVRLERGGSNGTAETTLEVIVWPR